MESITLEELYFETFPHIFDQYYNPATQLNEILNILRECDFTPLIEEDLTIQARAIVRSIVEKIKNLYGKRLNWLQIAILDRIHEGTVVLKDMSAAVDLINSYLLGEDIDDSIKLRVRGRNMELGIGEGKIEVIVDRMGSVIKNFEVVILNPELFSENISLIEFIIAHELGHILGDNNLPRLLNEAATDHFAFLVTGHKVLNRFLLWRFALAYLICTWLIRSVSYDLVWQVYCVEACEEEVQGSDGIWRWNALVGMPFHDLMRQRYGERWDRFIKYLIEERLIRGTFCLFFWI